MKKEYPNIRDLNKIQFSHLVNRVARRKKTSYFSAKMTINLEYIIDEERYDIPVNEALELLGFTKHSAKMQSTASINAVKEIPESGLVMKFRSGVGKARLPIDALNLAMSHGYPRGTLMIFTGGGGGGGIVAPRVNVNLDILDLYPYTQRIINITPEPPIGDRTII